MYVAPSILSADFGNLAAEIRAICEAGCDLVHVESPSFSENSRKYCGDGRIVK